jgi:hypothetical protein
MVDKRGSSEQRTIDAAVTSGQTAAGAAHDFNPIFLLSAPRSGSAWLRDMLGEHPEIATGPETYAFEALGWFLATVEGRSDRGQGLLGAGYIDRRGLGRACAELYRTAVGSRLAGRAYFVEKTPLNTDFIEAIDLAFPAAKLLHLVRDGRDVICSMMAANRERGMILPDTVRGGALRWKRIERVTRFGRQHPERYCEVRYEALLADPRPELQRIFAFLAVALPGAVLEHMCAAAATPRHPSRASAAHGYIGKWRRTFSAEDVRVFKETAGRLLIDLGYEGDGDW